MGKEKTNGIERTQLAVAIINLATAIIGINGAIIGLAAVLIVAI